LHLICDNYRDPQVSGGQTVARHSCPFPSPLHAYRRLVTQSGRALLHHDYRASHPPRAGSTACAAWRRRLTGGWFTGTKIPALSAGPSPRRRSNAASVILHLFARRDTRVGHRR
jgi:hypothetical protein